MLDFTFGTYATRRQSTESAHSSILDGRTDSILPTALGGSQSTESVHSKQCMLSNIYSMLKGNTLHLRDWCYLAQRILMSFLSLSSLSLLREELYVIVFRRNTVIRTTAETEADTPPEDGAMAEAAIGWFTQ